MHACPVIILDQRRFDRKRWGNNQDKICARNKCWNMLLECVMKAKMAEASQFYLPFLEFAAVFCSV